MPEGKKQSVRLPQLPAGYQYEQEVAAGAQGAVWLILNKNMGDPGRREAVKILHHVSPREYQRFCREINTLASLSHPNIVTIYYANAQQSYFIMEYLAGGSLQQVMKREDFSLLRALQMMKQVADGLHFAHSKGLIHRDLKPQNILFTAGMIPKITDFGLAKAISSEGQEGMTAPQISLGTPNYISPEQWEDSKNVDHRSDIWSCGVILYLLLTKRLPFEGVSGVNLMYAALMKPVDLPRLANPKLSPLGQLAEPICMKALEKKRENRYQTALELSQALAKILRQSGAAAQPAPAPGVVRPKANSVATPTTNATPTTDTTPALLGFRDEDEPTTTMATEPTEPKTAATLDFQDEPAPAKLTFADPPVAEPPKAVPISAKAEHSYQVKKHLTLAKIQAMRKQLALTGAALVLLIAVWILLAPPSLARLKQDVLSGKSDTQLKALTMLSRQDTRAIPIIILALNSKNSVVRDKAANQLYKFGAKSIPDLLAILENNFEEYNEDAYVTTFKLLTRLQAQEAEQPIYAMAISSKTPMAVRQAAIENLVELAPKYQKYYALYEGIWYALDELQRKRFVKTEKGWQPLTDVLARPRDEAKKAQQTTSTLPSEEEQQKLMATGDFETKVSLLQPFSAVLGQYQQIIAKLYPLEEYELRYTEIPALHDEIADGVLLLFKNMELLRQKCETTQAISALALYQLTGDLLAQAKTWKWSSQSQARQKLAIFQRNFELTMMSFVKRLEVPVVLNISAAKEPARWAGELQAEIIALFRRYGKIAVLASDAKAIGWFTLDYEEKSDFQATCQIGYWLKSGDAEAECMWEKQIAGSPSAGVQQMRQSFCEQWRKWQPEWDKIVAVSATTPATKKVEGSTLAKQNATDIVYLKDGRTLKGLIEEESPDALTLVYFERPSPDKRVIAKQKVTLNQVQKIDRIADEIRQVQLQLIKQTKKNTRSEEVAIASLALVPIAWEFAAGGTGWQYEDSRFVLYSNAPEEFVRRIAFRVSEIFKAYQCFFRVERNLTRKIKIYVFSSMAEYSIASGKKILNPAYYAPDKNYIVAGCDIEQYEAEVAAIRDYHNKIKAEIIARRAEVVKFKEQMQSEKRREHQRLDEAVKKGDLSTTQYNQSYKAIRQWEDQQLKKIREYEKRLAALQDEIAACDYKNFKALQKYAGQMIKILYHEAFHAFLFNFLFTEQDLKHVSVWIHEGLAQFFENSFIEGNTLLIGTMDQQRVTAIKKYIRENRTVPLAKLLVADNQQFLVMDKTNLENSDIHYLESWAVVYYLLQQYDLTQGNFFEEYVSNLSSGMDTAKAFQKLIQQPLTAFDEAWKKQILQAK